MLTAIAVNSANSKIPIAVITNTSKKRFFDTHILGLHKKYQKSPCVKSRWQCIKFLAAFFEFLRRDL